LRQNSLVAEACGLQPPAIEDARFVLFHKEDGTRTYYATYTAYDGKMILPQFLETSDFLRFKFITLNGPAVENKGLALFPRKIGSERESDKVPYSRAFIDWHSEAALATVSGFREERDCQIRSASKALALEESRRRRTAGCLVDRR
jgi:predicted GH43/DUF377 family glycosyl hydrolase